MKSTKVQTLCAILTLQDGDTALILAAEGGHTLTVQALTGGGADPNIQDRVSGSHCSTAGLCSMCVTAITARPFLSVAYILF